MTILKRMSVLVLFLALPLLVFAQDQASGSNQGTGQAAGQTGDQGAVANQGQSSTQGGASAGEEHGTTGGTNATIPFGGGLVRITSADMNVPIKSDSGDISGNVRDMIVNRNGELRYLVVDTAQGMAQNQQQGSTQSSAGVYYVVPSDKVKWEASSNEFRLDMSRSAFDRLTKVQAGNLSASMQQGTAARGPNTITSHGEVEPTGTSSGAGVARGPNTITSHGETEPTGTASGSTSVARGPNTITSHGEVEPAGTAAGNLNPGQFLLSQFIGSAVYNDQNVELGRVEAVVFNVPQTRIEYLAMSTQGILGAGDRYIAVPMKAFVGYDPAGQRTVVSITRQAIASAPGFRPNGAWPGSADRSFDFSSEAAGEGGGQQR